MFELQSQSPLDHFVQLPIEAPGVRISEIPDVAIFGLSVSRTGDAAEAARDVIGAALPSAPNSSVAQGNLWVTWMTPTQWRLTTTRADAPALLTSLERLKPALWAFDISDALCAISIDGARASDLLSTGVPIDLHPRRFSTGCAAATLFHTIPVHIQQAHEAPAYRILVERSLAHALCNHLVEAARFLAPACTATKGIEVSAA